MGADILSYFFFMKLLKTELHGKIKTFVISVFFHIFDAAQFFLGYFLYLLRKT